MNPAAEFASAHSPWFVTRSELSFRLVDLRYGNIQVEGSGAQGDRPSSWVRVSLWTEPLACRLIFFGGWNRARSGFSMIPAAEGVVIHGKRQLLLPILFKPDNRVSIRRLQEGISQGLKVRRYGSGRYLAAAVSCSRPVSDVFRSYLERLKHGSRPRQIEMGKTKERRTGTVTSFRYLYDSLVREGLGCFVWRCPGSGKR